MEEWSGGMRACASVVNVCSVDLKGLVCVPCGGVTLNAYAMGGANAKREQSATKITPAGHASESKVVFVLRNDDG